MHACGYFFFRKNGTIQSTISDRALTKENTVISTPKLEPVATHAIENSITKQRITGETPFLFFFATNAGNRSLSAAAWICAQVNIITGTIEVRTPNSGPPTIKNVRRPEGRNIFPTSEYSGSVVKTKIQAFYNELIYVTG